MQRRWPGVACRFSMSIILSLAESVREHCPIWISHLQVVMFDVGTVDTYRAGAAGNPRRPRSDSVPRHWAAGERQP